LNIELSTERNVITVR